MFAGMDNFKLRRNKKSKGSKSASSSSPTVSSLLAASSSPAVSGESNVKRSTLDTDDPRTVSSPSRSGFGRDETDAAWPVKSLHDHAVSRTDAKSYASSSLGADSTDFAPGARQSTDDSKTWSNRVRDKEAIIEELRLQLDEQHRLLAKLRTPDMAQSDGDVTLDMVIDKILD